MEVKQERNPKRQSLDIINQRLAQFKPDIIEIDEPERLWTTLFTLPGLAYAKANNIPYIACYRTNFVDYLQDYIPGLLVGIAKLAAIQLTKWIYNQCSRTLIGSQFIKQKLINWGIKNVDYEQVVGPPLVENPELLENPTFFYENYGLEEIDQSVKILFLSRLSPDKNWDFNCQHLPRLKTQAIHKKYTILIAGQGELEEEIAASDFAKILPTFMLGTVPHEQIPQLLANVDLHVCSSLKETFGRTVQESFYAGTPVLVPDCDWTQNLVDPDINGVLYQPQNGQDFIKKLAHLINTPGDRQKMKKNILATQSRQKDPAYTWIEYLQKMVNSTQKSINK
jgi:glycosyltransferase involved in cell wall biosynthesis